MVVVLPTTLAAIPSVRQGLTTYGKERLRDGRTKWGALKDLGRKEKGEREKGKKERAKECPTKETWEIVNLLTKKRAMT
jgi:hypothetical protein